MISKTNTFSASYILRKDKKDVKEAPLVLRIVVNGRKAEIFMKRKIAVEKWNSRKKLSGSTPEIKDYNRYLDRMLNKVHQIYDKLVLADEPISAEIIKNHLLGIGEEESITLLRLTKYHKEEMKHTLAEGTLKHYNTTERYFVRFLRHKKNLSDIHLSRIDYKFIIDFENFLRAWKPKDHRRPIQNNGVMKHMTRLKKLINLALRMDWMEKNPFKNYRMKFNYTQRACLTDQELAAIEEKDLRISRLSLVRDIFVFCCYTGLSHIDVSQLKVENIVPGIDGNRWISFKRQKTNHAFQVPLLPKAISILEKYKDYPRIDDGMVLPVFSNQKTNSYLKEIADICGIKKNLTFHLA
ncbi:MAG: phage integrase SAM-like domain-containing protein, partial [Cyclobacteriaceae bacterium]